PSDISSEPRRPSRKASSTTNIVDDLTSIFGGASSSGEFQDVEGEIEERRRVRLDRHQRTQERAAKALAEKNERDRQTQRDRMRETCKFCGSTHYSLLLAVMSLYLKMPLL
ncbi:hypothetical protein IFM89_030436, partial [Coptis chinensis]